VKLVLLGGAGFRTPAMYEAVHDVRDALGVDELVLYDVDDARLPRVLQVLEGIDRERGSRVAVRATADLDDALEGADVVYSAIRVGGIASRIVDETVPLGHGVLGQETTGPGGIAFALRTIPVMRDIAERTAARAPTAWFMNFTNPAGMITEAISEVLGDRAFGICDTPRGMFRRIAALLGRPPERLWFDYAGLNHLGFLQAVRDGTDDLLPGLLEDDALLDDLEEASIFDHAFLRALGMIPNEYLAYYYGTAEVVRRQLEAGRTRGQEIADSQRAYFATEPATPEEALAAWRSATQARSSTYMAEAGALRDDGTRAGHDPDDLEGYAGVALRAALALRSGKPTVMVLNARNRSALPFLDPNAIVETVCVVTGAGVRTIATAPLPLHARGLIEQMKEVERTTIAAALQGSARLAARALALHPLVPSTALADRILEGYRTQEPHLAALLS
jgi:6-phospho-beta-glucosidase